MRSGKWMLLMLLALACAGPPRLATPRVYAQQLGDDSISEHCKYHPEMCLEAFGPEAGTAATSAAPAAPTATTIDGAVAIGTGMLGASIVTTVQLSTSQQARIESVLRQCADQAYASVLKERFGGKNPSKEQCNEQVGTARNGEPISLAMKLGDEMHRAAYQCLKDKLRQLIGERYSIEQRYGYNPRTRRTTVVKKEDEEWLEQHGHGDELRYSIVPDLVIHKGDPRFVQAAYDFKFPCADPDSIPPWRRYPSGHPAIDSEITIQGEVYKKVLQNRQGCVPHHSRQESPTMMLRSPGIQVPISDNGVVMMRESMRLSFYLPHMHRRVASDVVRSLERYAETIVPKLDTHYDDQGQPQDLDASAWEKIKQATLGGAAYIQVIGSYERVAFEYWGGNATSPRFPNSVSAMHCWFPTEYVEERGTAHLRALAVDILGALPIHSGNLALDLHPLMSDAGLTPTFGEIALRYPGFSIDVADKVELGTRVHDVTWLTFLGQPALSEVGGVAALRSRLHSPDTSVEELPGDRAVITLGEWPDAGDVAEGRTLPNYRELARALEPVLYRERREGWSRVYPEQLRQVERRFLD